MEENSITSVQNARIKHVVALQQKSSLRREEGLFVVEGQREIEHCIACGYEVVEVFMRSEECGVWSEK
jgi:TrmH family RNA methyltransferase